MIPKIIHQLWIGDAPPPTSMMNTWRDKHPECEYIRWSEDEIVKRGLPLSCVHRINEMEEICGKADIIRWEILYHYGGVFIDADSICIEPIDQLFKEGKSFASYENEACREGLVAVGTMAFTPKHPLVRECIEWIQNNDCSVNRTKKRAWMLTGPVLLTAMINTNKYKDVLIHPSYYFLPQHFSDTPEYTGHGKVYAHQEWGSTYNGYDSLVHFKLPDKYLPPSVQISILVSSFNTKQKYIQECLKSIKNQVGHFHIELVWINDGSDDLHTKLLKKSLEELEKNSRFLTVVYKENETNKGLGYTLNDGIRICSNELIFKMDSDDIMRNDRIKKQLEYMISHPETNLCGGQIEMFAGEGIVNGTTRHPSLTWDNFKQNPSHWFMNHPTLCYRKSAVLEVGNYNPEFTSFAEDFELEIRMLKKYGHVHNMPDVLVNYRLHEEQATFRGGEKSGGQAKWRPVLNDLIMNMCSE